MPLRCFMELLDILRHPAHEVFGFIAVCVVYAWTHAFLSFQACCIECLASLHIDGLVDTEMVSRCYKYCTWLVYGILQFFLDLGKLRMGPATVDDLRNLFVWNL